MPALLFTVESIQDVTPLMRRVTFAGDDVARYIAAGRFPNIKLFMPRADGTFGVDELDDPGCGADTEIRTRHELHARVRTYTVRSHDAENGTLSVDFVRHGDDGLASGWAEHAQVGSTIGIAGGGGRGIGVGEQYLLCGDETGLPGIGNILEGLPESARGVAYVEINNDAERQELRTPAGFEVVWLSREGAAGGTTSLLADAVAAHELAPGTFAWCSAESQQVIAIRKNLSARGVDRRSRLIIGYWRRGLTENGYSKAANNDRDLRESADHEHDHEHGHPTLRSAVRETSAHLLGRLRR